MRDRDLFFLQIAELYATRATCPRAHVGCVAVRDNRIIATGYNGSLKGAPHCEDVGCIVGPDWGCTRTVHAEANVIAYAAKHGVSLSDCALFCTLSPCESCARLIVQSGITQVVCGERYRDESGMTVLRDGGVNLVFPM